MRQLQLSNASAGHTHAERLRDGLLFRCGIPACVAPFLTLVARVSLLVVLFVLLDRAVRGAGTLPQASYFHRFLFIELGERIVWLAVEWRWLLVPAVLIVALLLMRSASLRRRLARLGRGWADLDHGSALRLFIPFVAFVLAWAYATYDFNLYFDQAHYADRILLLLLVPLLAWRPAFVFPFLLLLVALVAQFEYPLRAQTRTEVDMLIRVLVLFGAAFVLYALTGRRKTDDFLFVLCCLIAASYWWPGMGKLGLNWISHPRINLMIVGAYANGWLAFLEPATVAWLAGALAWLSLPLMAGTLLIEAGALFILWNRLTLVGFLAGFILMHLGIVAASGIFFWKWMLVEAALLGFLLSQKRVQRLPLFTRAHFLLSLVLIGGGVLWARPANLSWYETPLVYTYRMEGVGQSGQTYRLPTRLFAPYADAFTLGHFAYLTSRPQLTTAYGVTRDHALADSLLRLRPDQIFALEQTHPAPRRNAAARERFDEFMTRFISNLNERGSKRTWLSWMQAPPHLLSSARGGGYAMQEPIRKVIVYQVTSLYDGARYADIRKRRVREIVIPPSDER